MNNQGIAKPSIYHPRRRFAIGAFPRGASTTGKLAALHKFDRHLGCAPRCHSRLALPLAGAAPLTQVSFTDRDGAGRAEKELLAFFRYAVTGSFPFGLAHVGLRIPVSQARFQPLCDALLDLLNLLGGVAWFFVFVRFCPGCQGHGWIVSGLPFFGWLQQHVRLLWFLSNYRCAHQ